MFGDCENCPAKTWLCEYYNFKPACASVLKEMDIPKEALDDGKVHSCVLAELTYIEQQTLRALGVPPGFLGARRDKEYVMELRAMVEYFLTIKREFCTCVVDAFCNKTDDKCDKCKEYDEMVEKAKKLLEEK